MCSGQDPMPADNVLVTNLGMYQMGRRSSRITHLEMLQCLLLLNSPRHVGLGAISGTAKDQTRHLEPTLAKTDILHLGQLRGVLEDDGGGNGDGGFRHCDRMAVNCRWKGVV